MKLELVTFEQAKALEELGFPQNIISYGEVFDIRTQKQTSNLNYIATYGYDELCISAPTLELAAKWLREEKKIHICPIYYSSKTYKQEWYSLEVNQHQINDDYDYTSYEEALSVGIDKAIEILKESYEK